MNWVVVTKFYRAAYMCDFMKNKSFSPKRLRENNNSIFVAACLSIGFEGCFHHNVFAASPPKTKPPTFNQGRHILLHFFYGVELLTEVHKRFVRSVNAPSL